MWSWCWSLNVTEWRFGHSGLSKVIDFGGNLKRICDFLLVLHSNLGHILHHRPKQWVEGRAMISNNRGGNTEDGEMNSFTAKSYARTRQHAFFMHIFLLLCTRLILVFLFFTSWCTIVQSAVLRLHVVCPSACLSVTLVDQDHVG